MKTFSRRHALCLGAAATAAPFLKLRAQEAGQKKLGVALLGLGDYATKQLGPALKKTSNARLAAIITGSPDKVPKWQQEYEIPDSGVYDYKNLEKIADNKDVDIIYVVTPTALHPEYTIRALEAGKHVICEKPMAPTPEDCARMIKAAADQKKMLQIGYRLHWDPFHLRLMEAIKTKEFGDWKAIDVVDAGRMNDFTRHNAWRVNKELGIAGALYDLGVYCVQAMLYSAQEHPLKVTAKSWTEREKEFSQVPEHWEWELEFSGGRKAKALASYGQNGNHVKVETEKGEIRIDPAYGYSGQKGFTPTGAMDFKPVFQQQLQIEGQVEAILSGKPSKVPGEMGRRDIQVIRGIMEAAESGKTVEFGKFDY
ncbi:Gfo/Idh/MocA family oxidoreductase [Haloferula sp. BvORR071]|uniref:Gfo/Idh/MocA family protein n=1 Tax=Haloferula sp. BvORR071 TaxID=1396141 RepID=UPI002241037D|nr:Gfo/Idh/MocA family oxidoreductase [Haloferula sp. BvORR071]